MLNVIIESSILTLIFIILTIFSDILILKIGFIFLALYFIAPILRLIYEYILLLFGLNPKRKLKKIFRRRK